MEIIENTSSKLSNKDNSIKIQDLLTMCLTHWRWFVISLVICLGAAALYLLRTPAVYTRSASILIKEDAKGQSVSSEMDFSNLGLFQSSTNINNEIITLRSPSTMMEVVNRLSLNVNYLKDGRLHKQVAYGTSLPVKSIIENLPNTSWAGYTINIDDNGEITLYDFILNGDDIESESVSASIGGIVNTPVGDIRISPTPFYNTAPQKFYVTQVSVQAAANAYAAKLNVAKAEESSSVINLSIKDVSIQRADDLLNTLISVYNENWVKDKNQIAVSTSVFINDRLAIIEKELGIVDEDISSYKSKHMIPDLATASSMYLSQSTEANARILEINNRLYMARYIRDHLADETNRYELLPATGTESQSIESQISEYNAMLLQRNNLIANSSEANPKVSDMDKTLDALRSAILVSLDNYSVMLETQLSTLESTEQQATDRIASTPEQAKYLLSVERQQKVKEALYLFLLQKREENELSQAFTAYNTRVINPPSGSGVPTSPVKTQIILIAFIIGLVIPLGIIFLKELTNTKVRGRKDINGLSVPFAGEIPLVKQGKKKDAETTLMAVQEGSRDVINEAFRVLRTNLEFMTNKDSRTDVILVTSFNPGSGKTFITMNTAMSLAVKNKKVLVIDGDLRKGSASNFLGHYGRGLSDWLAGKADDIHALIETYSRNDNLSILPVGTIPPNPTELLFDKRLPEMLDMLRCEFDFIFIDCPPINIVADTQILEKLSDRTLFIVRAGLLERNMLPELETIYNEERYKNMAVVLNGTESSGRYGYTYGYRYGYGYSHSYYNAK